jgi:hypothetical protein
LGNKIDVRNPLVLELEGLFTNYYNLIEGS